MAPGPLLSSCYMQPLEGKQPELTRDYHFNADDTVADFVFDLTLSPCMFDDILIPIHCRSSNAKLNFEADNSKYMIIPKSKNAKHGLLRLPEAGDYTEQVNVSDCYINCQPTLQRQMNFFFKIFLIFS